MYTSENFTVTDKDCAELRIDKERPFHILQLTDLHLGFGLFSAKKDRQALQAVEELIGRAKPDLIVLTGDSIYPFFPQSGTLNNRREAVKFLKFMDGFGIPYALIMGNHDTELGSKLKRPQLGELFRTGENAIFLPGPEEIQGVGNYMLKLYRGDKLASVLAFLDSNMYVTKYFWDGFDRIHEDQADWCMAKLAGYREENPDLEAMAFYHMPVAEFKEAYARRKAGDDTVTYHFGTVSEPEDYFGISCLPGTFFEKAVENGVIKYMFCGHDHLNNISLTYRGIRMTYGMSIDCLGYRGIAKKTVQRGATLITLSEDNQVSIEPMPLTDFVTKRVRGQATCPCPEQ